MCQLVFINVFDDIFFREFYVRLCLCVLISYESKTTQCVFFIYRLLLIEKQNRFRSDFASQNYSGLPNMLQHHTRLYCNINTLISSRQSSGPYENVLVPSFIFLQHAYVLFTVLWLFLRYRITTVPIYFKPIMMYCFRVFGRI